MSNSKKMWSFILAIVIAITSIVSSSAIIAPEDSISAQEQWMLKIDEILVEKMANASDTDVIPVWVWMTDIDMEQLDKDIETRTGINQQKLDNARAEIGYDVSTVSTNVENLKSSGMEAQNTVTTYLDATKEQRTKIAKDTETYLTAKKTLASQRYTTANTSKIRQLGISNNKIGFQSELTPSFIAFLTIDEIIEIAQSANVVEIGYFSEYDEDISPEPTQERNLMQNIEPTEEPTQVRNVDVSTMHTGIKQVIQHDLALDKHQVTGTEVTVLHVEKNYVLDGLGSYNNIPKPWNVTNYVDGTEFSPTEDLVLPTQWPIEGHANGCVSFLQAFAEDVEVYCVARNKQFASVNENPLDETGNNVDNRINSYDDIETLIITKNIDIINASTCEDEIPYELSYSSRWFDAIVATYKVTLVASAGNVDNPTNYQNVLSPAGGYNSIAVGIYDYSNNQMFDNFKYNFGDNKVSYKPDLVVAMNTTGGTSSGAPVVSAIVAMMMEKDPSLRGNPELIKAILMASCHEKALRSQADIVTGVPQENMEDGLTLKQGAGKINVLRALNIVEYGTYGYGTIQYNQSSSTAKRIRLNSRVFGNVTSGPPMNVSVSWLRANTKTQNNTPSANQITLGQYYDIDMKIQYTENGVNKELISETNNSGKQMIYCPTTNLDTQYSVKISWGSDNIASSYLLNYGYAYSVGSFEKSLDKVEVSGVTAVGRTLIANAYTADALPAVNGSVAYRWQRSDDGESWQVISGATSSEYTITDSDFNKRIRCIVNQNYLNNYVSTKELETKVVLYGDINNDGYVSVMDASIINTSIANQTEFTPEEIIAADVDGDGVVSVIDANLIQQYAARQIDKFPVENNT